MVTNFRTGSYICKELINSFASFIIEPMVTDDKQAFSNRLNAILDLAGFAPKGKGRQGDLGKIFKVTQKGARKWIEGESYPTLDKLIAITQHFRSTGVTIDWLLTGNEKYAPVPAHKSDKLHNPTKQQINDYLIELCDLCDDLIDKGLFMADDESRRELYLRADELAERYEWPALAKLEILLINSAKAHN
jgi:hypothetical protein